MQGNFDPIKFLETLYRLYAEQCGYEIEIKSIEKI